MQHPPRVTLAGIALTAVLVGQTADALSPPRASGPPITPPTTDAQWHTATANGVSVQVLAERAKQRKVDVLLVYHGTVGSDARVREATTHTLRTFRKLLGPSDMLIISVAYPEEGRLWGDNVTEAEAALLWLQHDASAALGVEVGRIFLGGHSQGGALVLRLNTQHNVDGVIANAPGPLDLVDRCGREERKEEPQTVPCTLLSQTYGPPSQAADAYAARSLVGRSTPQRSPLLLVQGMGDSAPQVEVWPRLRAELDACTDCAAMHVIEVPKQGHTALFVAPEAEAAARAFLTAP